MIQTDAHRSIIGLMAVLGRHFVRERQKKRHCVRERQGEESDVRTLSSANSGDL